MPKICDKLYTVRSYGLFARGSTVNRIPVTEFVTTNLTPPFRAISVPSGYFANGLQAFGVYTTDSNGTKLTTSGCFGVANADTCGYWGDQIFDITWIENETNCRCSNDSCRIDCSTSPHGFCCIDHSVTNRLLQIFAN